MIRYSKPIVEMDGDEMTRIIWRQIKDELLSPFIELNTQYYDLGLKERDKTDDRVTVEAGNAIKRLGVGVKCATITPNAARMEEYGLKCMYKSPNATIRAILDGTVFRTPILIDSIKPMVRGWKAPITIARHAFGDIYKAAEYRVDGACKAYITVEYPNGDSKRVPITDFEGKGVLQGMFNTDKSITAFAHSCFKYAIDMRQDLWFSTKDTISKTYDHTFKDIFQDVYKTYAADFKRLNIEYFYTLIDDAVARVIKSAGGFIWACKNYDGDVMSDMVSTAFGSLAMMTSVLVSPDGNYEFEAAHGTVTRHYYKHLAGEETSTNPMATIFAWSGALRKRGELEKNAPLIDFASALEKASLKTLNNGIMTKDLAGIASGNVKTVTTIEFIRQIAKELELMLA